MIHQVFKELLLFSTGSSVISLRYRFVFVLTITFVRGFDLLHFCNKKSVAQHSMRKGLSGIVRKVCCEALPELGSPERGLRLNYSAIFWNQALAPGSLGTTSPSG